VAAVTRTLHLRRLAQQPLRTAVATLAVAAGVALTAGVVLARASVQSSVEGFSSAIAGPAVLRVEGPVDHGGLDVSNRAALAAAPGVKAAVPIIVTVTVAVDGSGHERYVSALGVDCSIEMIIGPFGCDPAAVEAASTLDIALLPPALADALGPDGVIRSDTGDIAVRGAVVVPELAALGGGRLTVWPLATAQRVFGRPHGYDAVLIVPEPGVSTATLRRAVMAAAGPTAVVRGADDPLTSPTVVSQLLIGLLLSSLLGLTVGSQLVHNTLSLSFEERRRELAVVAAVGATPARIARGILAEAVLLGAIGGLLGALLGVFVAGAFVDALADQAARVSGVELTLHVSVAAIAFAVLVGIAAAAVAAIGPARRAAALDLAAELAERGRYEPERPARARVVTALLGIGTVAGLVAGWLGSRGGALETWQPAAAIGGMGLGSACAFRLPGALAPAAVRVANRLVPERAALTRVAIGNLVGDAGRTRAITTALAAAISLAITLGSIVPGLTAGGRTLAGAISGGRVAVSGIPLNNGDAVETKVSPADEARLAALPGVAVIEHMYDAELDHPSVGTIHLQAEEGLVARLRVYDGGDPDALLREGEVLIGPALARAHGLRPGDVFTVPGRLRPVTLTVGAVWAAPDGLGNNITMPVDQFEDVAGTRPASLLRLRPKPGVSPADVVDQARGAGLRSGVLVVDEGEYGDRLADEFSSFVDPFRALQRGLLLVAFAATASTLLLAAVQRRREHALLTAVGMAPGALARMTIIEAAVLGACATVLGISGGLVGAVGFAWASGVLTGLPISISPPLAVVPLAGAAATAVAIVGAAFPAWRTSRIDPAVALRYS
jgi:putative ABC transport system permease protein